MELDLNEAGPSSQRTIIRNPRPNNQNRVNSNWRNPNNRAISQVREDNRFGDRRYGQRNGDNRRTGSIDRGQTFMGERDAGQARNNRMNRTDNYRQNVMAARGIQQHQNPPGGRWPRPDQPNRNSYNKLKHIGFLALQEMAKSDVEDIIVKINEKRDAFLTLIQNPNDRPDIFVLVIDILSKASRSSFDELKLKLLLEICNSNFIKLFMLYLINLPYEAQRTNGLYWKNQNEFWNNYIIFCECIVNASPMTALKYCRSLIDATTKSCLDGLRDKHGYNLPEEYSIRLSEVRNKLTTFEEMGQPPQSKRLRGSEVDQPPPDDFRELTIVPNRDDLLIMRPYVRPNIVNGSYQDIDHYLDVQFRLLREDCYGPLREGIQQFINDPNRKRYDHIRVFRNVKFIRPYISQTKVGSVVQIDVRTNRLMKRINWANSKRFIFGSLVLFTKDNCKNFIVATILDRDPKQLSEGKIPVSIIGDTFDDQLYNRDHNYTLIESEVYFEPYYHVLKVLQDPKFPEDLAMQEYIVKVHAISKSPAYLKEDSQFVIYKDIEKNNPNRIIPKRLIKINTKLEFLLSDEESDEEQLFLEPDDVKGPIITKFKVLQNESWPDNHDLCFNETQYEAYKLALTHEFAVIQGPPGTGKTYLGIKVAKTLLQNISSVNRCLMLIICYTNHALDQFLEAILKLTHSVARIGGQSRNKNMEEININRLRKSMVDSNDNANRLFLEQRFELKNLVSELRKAQICLDVLTNGVISYGCICNDVREIVLLRNYYQEIGITNRDPLREWLFDYNPNDYWSSLENCLLEEELIDMTSFLDDDNHKRTEFIIDDDDDIGEIMGAIPSKIKASFSLNDTKSRLKDLIKEYTKKKEDNKTGIHTLNELGYHIQLLSSQIRFFNAMNEQQSRRINMRITPSTNFTRIRLADRWALYFMWVEDKINEVKGEILQLQTRMVPQVTAFEESRMVLDLQVLRNRKVVGMTTSGAARMRKLLQAIAPPIVIVEEAAEVLEQHIVSSLTKSCRHLILIGDHQQLRPSASHMKLARHYDIEVSLFERMIKNGIHSRRLGVQHRMRPEIAALISPHIYPDLENDPSVETFPDVLGMDKNVFFFSHQYEEEENIENSSKSNQKEGNIVLAVANYLMQQGYTADDITILAAYSGQMFYMRKERENYPYLKDVKVTVVDNYQGEESKIILLSLVRNNKENKIGFLGTENRICVALSRAKEGFYIFGNMDILKSNSELWAKIATTLDENNSLGTTINLKCQNHPNNITAVTNETDFINVPEGGCLLNCNFILRCGHKCRLLCHGYDREHVEVYTRCKIDCERILCDLNHKCPLKCWQICEPCKVLVEKTLPCGHNMKIPCHLDPEDPSVRCLTSTNVTLPDCSHEAKKLCFENIKAVKCKVRCDYRIQKCGHVCLKLCHVKEDPEHEQYECRKECAKAKKGCMANLEGDRGDHQCLKKCFEQCDDCNVLIKKKRSNCKHMVDVTCHKNPDETKCNMKCAKVLPCAHYCTKKCFEKCGDCKIKVMKEIADCKHKVQIECMLEPTRNVCKQKCERTLSCGHKCRQPCADDCDPSLCNELSTQKFKLPCGHLVSVPCKIVALIISGEASEDIQLQHCSEPCNQDLACEHVCSGTCATCHQGRLHAPCTQKCNQLNICGHPCVEPCNQICPPCNRPCEVRCQHSRCQEKCCVTCKPCQEKCSRRCAHRACSRRCGEQCDVAPCEKRCPRRLACGHPCRGVCGEPCPTICNECHPDEFPCDFLGDPYLDDAMFIQLQDCPHVIELEDMDTLMLGDADSIKIRTCPICRKPIINTNRYKNNVNKTFKEDINPIKIRVYGDSVTIKKKKIEVLEKIGGYSKTYRSMIGADNKDWTSRLQKLLQVFRSMNKVSLLDLEMLLIYHNILDMISACYQKYLDSKSTELNEELHKQIALICKVLVFKNKGRGVVPLKISQQRQKDAGNEIRRLNAIIQFSMILSHNQYKSTKSTPAVTEAYDKAKALVFSYKTYNEDECLGALKKLQEAVKVSGIVSKQERDLIVQAIGLKAGHWFKCPNGHYYCIDRCGGAMEESVCIECKAKVGGTDHKLLPTNSHARDIDGSLYPAYSEEANNLGNFLLDIQ
ncbi:hypothetical protein K1T71_007897 [Dendrolimus kikuchii]|uniref:Uncharacterized protein n=1 Tax=Dendrolimus kikuchii TaxID=765133 RepID=A0ACC1CYJ0_9NEOP|nr:hypothetical protein K1T71_007897 [Dendrolimus kikuchii]